ncbi:hypothetical protein LINPERPRIM_LOCUS32930 [Linum perenne]
MSCSSSRRGIDAGLLTTGSLRKVEGASRGESRR